MKRKNPQLLILIGAPGSGKSTFAKYFIRTEENWMRLCRDDFRTMHFTYSNLPLHEEGMITEMIDSSIETLLRRRCNVLLDATHCKAEYLNHYIEKFNHLADISFKIFEADAKTIAERCEKRNKETGKYIPANVQKRYMKELEELKKTFDFSTRPLLDNRVTTIEQDASLRKAIICDLDGTLALMNHRNPFDASTSDEDDLNVPVANTLKVFAKEGYEILLVSGREDRFREPTVRFLHKHNIPYHQLWMRQSKDFRKDSVIKSEIYEAEIKDKYFVEFVLDDRDQVVDLWRKELKLSCFQVNYGSF
ncbi:AAA family ATPase [Dysgonomonas sp. 520]|uniref:phosphatase domain-containing protein n=1 Tax=Dysgonomonas sp. 520 TaxID=2302931 RepID=UPI0013D0F70D|nr:AAA family ATPase [Dysgonomonas sp. 520]NDW08866.1 polynucleotide kinase [Dysgonomonas sp. 520]